MRATKGFRAGGEGNRVWRFGDRLRFEEDHPDAQPVEPFLGPVHDDAGGIIDGPEERFNGVGVAHLGQRSNGFDAHRRVRILACLGQGRAGLRPQGRQRVARRPAKEAIRIAQRIDQGRQGLWSGLFPETDRCALPDGDVGVAQRAAEPIPCGGLWKGRQGANRPPAAVGDGGV